MPVHLEVVEGPSQGRKIALTVGKTISVGRSAAKAMVALPEDDHLSGLHFSAGLKNGAVLFCNLSKTNPASMNGEPLQSGALKPGDSFQAGRNIFQVIGADNPYEAAYRLGGWGFQTIPDGWEIHEGTGLRHCESEPFRANLIAVEEQLPKDFDLTKYVDLQVSLGKQHLKAATFSAPNAAKIKGADEAMALSIHAEAEKGPAMQYQLYALHAGVVGVVTATALESQAHLLRGLLTQLLPGLTFFQG